MTTMDRVKVFMFCVLTACVFYILGNLAHMNQEPEPETFGFKETEHTVDYKIALEDSVVVIKSWEGYVMRCRIEQLEEYLLMDNL